MHRASFATSVVLVAAGLAGGCTHKHQVKVVPPAPPPAVTAAPAKVDHAPTPASPNLAVSDDLAAKCKLHFGNTEAAPKFAFDEFSLLPADKDVLQQVATCVTTGPLKGQDLQLVGRADPRGTDEYNLGLGQRRASRVGDYLQSLGVGKPQLAVTTRGALDATGKNEEGWKVDRRVDLELASP